MEKAIAVTPSKIQRLIHLAEDNSYRDREDGSRWAQDQPYQHLRMQCESSSGLLDLDDVDVLEAMTEPEADNNFLTMSTAFNPGEMTGRSTGTEEAFNKTKPMGRHSVAISAITNEMDKQTNEVHNLLRHSICNTTSYSFQSKRDLTADEASLVMREAPIPVHPSAQMQFPDSVGTNSSALSVGAYFQKRCSGFEAVLGKTDSPDKSMYSMPSISEVMPKHNYIDESLDSVPVRQSRLEQSEKLNLNNATLPKNYEKQTFRHTGDKVEKNNLVNRTFNAGASHLAVGASHPAVGASHPPVGASHPPVGASHPAMGASHPAVGANHPPVGPNHPAVVANHPSVGANHPSVSSAPESNLHRLRAVPSTSHASTRAAFAANHTDVLLRNFNAALRLTTEDTEESACPTENSISISKIADYLGKESNVSVSAMLQYNNRKKAPAKKQPLSEILLNFQEDKTVTHVTTLSETRKLDTASSAGTISTVVEANRRINNQNIPQENVPDIVVSKASLSEQSDKNTRRSTRSKSPSSKSQSTLTTVQENCSSLKSGDSPVQTSKDEVNSAPVLSPNIQYRELDKSVDWHDVLLQKRLKQQSLSKEQWVEIVTSPANGFVGVNCPVNCTVTTLTDSWLTAKLKFHVPVDDENIMIDPPRLPLLSPGKTEKFTFYVTSNIELDATISFTVYLKDASIDLEIEQECSFDVHIKIPMIQAMSSGEINKVTFPPVQETCSLLKSFVLVSDCSADLQLELSVVEGDQVFSIKSVQEIMKSDVNKVLVERHGSVEEMQLSNAKAKGKNRQLCRLSNGNAIRVTVHFHAPKISELQLEESIAMFNGALNVNLFGVNTVLRKVDLVGTVGTVNLVVKLPGNKLHLTSEPTNLTLTNTGSVNGVWVVKAANTTSFPFKVVPSKFDIRPAASRDITLFYTGPEDTESSATLVFEDLITYQKTGIKITGGSDMPKSFPIKTNYCTLSFVRPGRMEINLKNSTSKKVYIRTMIRGEGFSIDLPGLDNKGVYCLPFAPSECRTLTIVFEPESNVPYVANLHLVYDKNSDLSRNVRLFGCWSEESLRWAGLLTYNDMALVRAAGRQPLRLELYNRSSAPVFLAAKPHFHLQYNAVEASARLIGNNRVIPGRARHALTLAVEWARVERCARTADTGAFATLTVLTGAEITRRRILKVIRDESSGVLDTSLLADHLRVLAGPFEGEDPNIDKVIAEFKETKASLTELIGGLQQLTAQIVRSQDYENTTIVTEDTVVEHHTLCD